MHVPPSSGTQVAPYHDTPTMLQYRQDKHTFLLQIWFVHHTISTQKFILDLSDHRAWFH